MLRKLLAAAAIKKESRQSADAPIASTTAGSKQYEDLGFGGNLNANAGRFMREDGSFNIVRHQSGLAGFSGYQWLVTTSWWKFFAVIFAFYVLSNGLLALLFMAGGIEHLSGVARGTWWENYGEAFFFSIQTFTTVGYGSVSPQGWVANVIAALGALIGLMSFALATGLFFARFSRPVARVRFSKQALIAPYRDHTGFMFRVVNLMNSQLMDVEVQVVLTWLEDHNGKRHRSFRRLTLERERIAMFPLNWTIVHPIDAQSPLFQKNERDLQRMDVEFIVILKGYDDTFAQHVNANHSYKMEEMVVGGRFAPMYYVNTEGQTVLEIQKVDLFDRVDLPPTPPPNRQSS